jgi:hypothetical protein
MSSDETKEDENDGVFFFHVFEANDGDYSLHVLKIMFVLCMFMKMMMVFVLLHKYQDWANLLLILKILFEITCFQVQGHIGFHHYSSTTS